MPIYEIQITCKVEKVKKSDRYNVPDEISYEKKEVFALSQVDSIALALEPIIENVTLPGEITNVQIRPTEKYVQIHVPYARPGK